MLYGRFLYECIFLSEGAPKAVSSSVFPNLKRMHKYWNLPLHFKKKLSFNFLVEKKRNISMGTWEHIKLGELPKIIP
jgi:hypothetical protein